MHVARTAVVGHDTCIGAGTVLEEACQVTTLPGPILAVLAPGCQKYVRR